MIIRYSARATKDLENIREYLAERSPKGAVNVLTAIYATIEFIRRHPEAAVETNIFWAFVVRSYCGTGSRFSSAFSPAIKRSKFFTYDICRVARGRVAMIRRIKR